MIEPNPTASTASPQPHGGAHSILLKLVQTRPARRAALVAAALIVSYVAGSIIFRAVGYRKGYRAGYESVGYYEGAAIADSMIGDASRGLLTAAGLVPGPDQHGRWYVARFELKHGDELCRFGRTPGLDTLRVPAFTEHEQAPIGRSYRSGSDGRIHYVDR